MDERHEEGGSEVGKLRMDMEDDENITASITYRDSIRCVQCNAFFSFAQCLQR